MSSQLIFSLVALALQLVGGLASVAILAWKGGRLTAAMELRAASLEAQASAIRTQTEEQGRAIVARLGALERIPILEMKLGMIEHFVSRHTSDIRELAEARAEDKGFRKALHSNHGE